MGLNCAIYDPATNVIVRFVRDCIKRRNSLHGTNMRTSLKTTDFAIKWTYDDCDPVIQQVQLPPRGSNPDGGAEEPRYESRVVGWSKTADELSDAGVSLEVEKVNHVDYGGAIAKLKDIADLTYSQLDDYIDANVIDLPSAKVYIKKLSKAVLAALKVLEHKL